MDILKAFFDENMILYRNKSLLRLRVKQKALQ